MKFLLKILFLLTAFLTPLLGSYKGFGYEQIKVLFFILSISLIGFLHLKAKFRWSPIAKTGGIFILVLLSTSLIGVDPKTSLLGIYPYFQGMILYAYFYLFFLLVSYSKIKFDHWAYVLVGSASLVALLAIKDWILLNLFYHQIPNYAGRVVSTFGQPNFYSGFLLLSLPFFYFFLKKKTIFWPFITLAFLITILAIILSYSRVSFLLLSLLILFWLIWEFPFRKLVFGITLSILLILSVISLNFSAGWIEKELTQLKSTNNPDLPTIGVEKRYYFWPILGKLILERPVVGYGLENIAPVFSDYFEKNKHALFEENLKVQPYMFGLKDLNLDRSHNYILDLLLFSGIPGMLSWLILIVTLFIKLTQKYDDRRKSVLLVSLIVYLIWIQFQNQSVVHLIYFWLLVGLIDSN